MVEAAFDLPADPAALALLSRPRASRSNRASSWSCGATCFGMARARPTSAGRLTSAATLRALAECLVDIHGQHPGQPLLDPRRHREILDAYAGCLAEAVRATASVRAAGRGSSREREALVAAERERERRTELLEFQRREIEGAHLSPARRRRSRPSACVLANHERLFSAVEQAYVELGRVGGRDPGRAWARSRRGSRGGRGSIRGCAEILEALETAIVHLRRGGAGPAGLPGPHRVRPAAAGSDRGAAARDRQAEAKVRRQRPGRAPGAARGRARETWRRSERSEARLQEVERGLRARRGRTSSGAAERLSAARRERAQALQKAVLAELAELGMAKAAFEVRVASSPAGRRRSVPTAWTRRVPDLAEPRGGAEAAAQDRLRRGTVARHAGDPDDSGGRRPDADGDLRRGGRGHRREHGRGGGAETVGGVPEASGPVRDPPAAARLFWGSASCWCRSEAWRDRTETTSAP